MRLRPAVFVDKDGTLVEDVPFNVEPDLLRLTEGAGEALALLRQAGFAIVLVSNQSGIGLGRFPASALGAVDDRLQDLLSRYGARLDATYYCPHAPATAGSRSLPACTCRKPAPGLLYQAAREHGLHLRRSWMIGDILDDVEAGRAAGCRTLLLDNGGETEWRLTPGRRPDFTARTLLDAARIIASRDAAAQHASVSDGEGDERGVGQVAP